MAQQPIQFTPNINKVLSIDQRPLRELPEDCVHLIITAKRKEQRLEQYEEARGTVTDLRRVMFNSRSLQ